MRKSRKFENVKEGNIVSFYNKNKMIEQGIVTSVNTKTFQVRTLNFYDKNGIKCFYDLYHNFYKTGTKSHSHYTYGNAIEITTNW